MSLLDKIKDLFTDEEEIIEEDEENVVKIKEIKNETSKNKDIDLNSKNENKLPSYFKEDEEDLKEPVEDTNISSRVSSRLNKNLYTDDTVELPKTDNNSFKFPIEFDESDYITETNNIDNDLKELEEIKTVNRETNDDSIESNRLLVSKKEEKRVADLYKDGKKEEKERRFKASPIISPIYGVLDKNYSKDEIKEIDEASYEIKRTSVSKQIDFDSVRRKAYGSLTDDIKDNLMCENCELLKEVREEKEEKKKSEKDNNLVYDILKEDNEETNDADITFGDATENYYDYGVEYEPPVKKREERKKEEIEVEIKTREEDNQEKQEEKEIKRKKKDIPPVKSNINLLSTLKKSMGEEEKEDNSDNPELSEDLFNMIDSMYDERDD